MSLRASDVVAGDGNARIFEGGYRPFLFVDILDYATRAFIDWLEFMFFRGLLTEEQREPNHEITLTRNHEDAKRSG